VEKGKESDKILSVNQRERLKRFLSNLFLMYVEGVLKKIRERIL
jgi:hypothetical protein